ncbi:MAG: copper homeostasis protein CutC [Saprospiraceae bacterium]|nr:copper homeostasis protein CutC [Saprospiraceae bacterium]
MRNYLLEICCDTLEDCLAAQQGGADRIELCALLPTGGLTPTFDLFKNVKKGINIPVFVLIRCREGNFVYSKEETDRMVHQIREFVSLGADGIVCGALTPDGQLDISATQQFIHAAAPLPFTFHRAFDAVKNPEQALQQLIELGTSRILTSGLQPTALQGLPLLKKLQHQAGEALTILVAGGVRPHNLPELVQQNNFREFHSAARPTPSGRVLAEWVEDMK